MDDVRTNALAWWVAFHRIARLGSVRFGLLERAFASLEEAWNADASALRALVRDRIAAQPLAEIDYVSLADPETLVELDGLIRPPALLSLAVRFGAARLIDNVTLRA